METIEEVRTNNMLISLLGINFINPVFRRIAGQLPYELPKLTISEADEKKKEMKFKKLCKEKKEPFLLIIRDEEANLEEVLFVPAREKSGSIQTFLR